MVKAKIELDGQKHYAMCNESMLQCNRNLFLLDWIEKKMNEIKTIITKKDMWIEKRNG